MDNDKQKDDQVNDRGSDHGEQITSAGLNNKRTSFVETNTKANLSSTMRKNLIIDVVALLVYLVVANPGITGIGIHEWLGLGIFVVLLVHAITHYDWIVDVVKNREKKTTLARQGNLILDILLVITFMVVTISGIGISGEILPRMGFYVDGYYFWGPLHSISAKVLLALFVVHLVVHWKWIVALFRKEKSDKDERKEN